MLLGLSNTDRQTDFSIVSGKARADTGSVPAESLLIAFADAVLSRDETAVEKAAGPLARAIGETAFVEAACVVAHFDAINRVADAAGISLDAIMEAKGQPIVDALGLRRFDGVGA